MVTAVEAKAENYLPGFLVSRDKNSTYICLSRRGSLLANIARKIGYVVRNNIARKIGYEKQDLNPFRNHCLCFALFVSLWVFVSCSHAVNRHCQCRKRGHGHLQLWHWAGSQQAWLCFGIWVGFWCAPCTALFWDKCYLGSSLHNKVQNHKDQVKLWKNIFKCLCLYLNHVYQYSIIYT